MSTQDPYPDPYVAGQSCRACRQLSCKCKAYREQGVPGFGGQNFPVGSQQALIDSDCDTDEPKPWAILDNGTYMQRAGYSFQDAPSATFRSLIGRQPGSRQRSIDRGEREEYYVGEEALVHWNNKFNCPLEHGLVKDWDDMEKLWKHTFDYELRVIVGDRDDKEAEEDIAGVMLTEPPMNPKKNREQTTQIMFEAFQVRRFYLAMQAVLSMYASGRTTGVVVDSGGGVTHSVPCFDGYSMPHAIQRIKLGGSDLDNYICKLLPEAGILGSDTYTEYGILSSAERESAQRIKEELCYASMAFDDEVDNFAGKEQTFQLPDHSQLTVHNQLIRVPELMFKPWLDDHEMVGLHNLVATSVLESDMDLRTDLLSNVIMAGANTMFPNLGERLQRELETMTYVETPYPCDKLARFLMATHPRVGASSVARGLSGHMLQHVASFLGSDRFARLPNKHLSIDRALFRQGNVKVLSGEDNHIKTWTGGSILSSMSTFARQGIERWGSWGGPDTYPPIVGYDEVGPRIVHQMCNH